MFEEKLQVQGRGDLRDYSRTAGEKTAAHGGSVAHSGPCSWVAVFLDENLNSDLWFSALNISPFHHFHLSKKTNRTVRIH